MLDKDVFFNKFDELIIVYPNWKIKYDDAKVMKLWYKHFSNFDDERFIHMIDQYIDSNNFNPTIAGLRECDTLPRKSATQIAHELTLSLHKAQKEKENA